MIADRRTRSGRRTEIWGKVYYWMLIDGRETLVRQSASEHYWEHILTESPSYRGVR